MDAYQRYAAQRQEWLEQANRENEERERREALAAEEAERRERLEAEAELSRREADRRQQERDNLYNW